MLQMIMHSSRLHPTIDEAQWQCKYCHRVFVREDYYLQHECRQMKREAEFKSPTGQAALNYYVTWMTAQKRSAPQPASFMASKYFRTFINFTLFARSVDLPLPNKFIWLMVQKNYQPTLWCTDEAYSMYLEFLDRKTPPIEQAKLSIQTLIKQADRFNTTIDNVFDSLVAPDIIQLLRTRRLSPWLLLFSKKFKHMFANETTPEQRIIIENLIRPEFWSGKLAEHADDVVTIKMLIGEMGI